MTKSILFGASNPDSYDGSVALPDADVIFPGTIWSFQPGHPEYGLSGAPTNGQTIKNAAWRQLAALTGRDSGDEAECHGNFVLGSDVGATKFKQEITPKGGLHSILTQSAGSTSNTYGYVRVPDAVKQWIFDHSTIGGSSTTDTGQVWNTAANHRFAMVLWVKMTRIYRTDSGKTGNNGVFAGIASASNVGGAPTFGSFDGDSNNPSYPVIGVENTSQSTTSQSLIGNAAYPPLPMVVDTPVMRWIATRGWFNSFPANIAAFMGYCGAGHLPGNAQSGYLDAAMSYVLYRWDIVDLWQGNDYGVAKCNRSLVNTDWSHSGGDLFKIRDQYRAAFARAFAVGGQHYGDTLPTAPGSIP